MLLYKQLLHIAHRSEHSTTSSAGFSLSRAEGALVPQSTVGFLAVDVGSDLKLVQARDMLTGVVAFVKAARYSSFSERCLGMPSPSTNPVYVSVNRFL
jgi:hypothetical protein